MTPTIDYTEILKALEHASLFDLYRLSVSMRNRMEDPAQILKIRQSIQEGEILSYFDGRSNGLQKAKIIQKNPKYVLVQQLENNKRWKIPYYMLNLESKNIDVTVSQTKILTKDDVKIGECAGFQNEKGQIIGVIVRRNQKTVTMITRDNCRWRVSYACLFKVIDAELTKLFFTQPELFFNDTMD
jgi:hypothetical protein